MTKSDLENRMVVKFRNGQFGLVVDDSIMVQDGSRILLGYYDDNLLVNSYNDDCDIILVYRQTNDLRVLFNPEEYEQSLSLCWEREIIERRERAFIDCVVNDKNLNVFYGVDSDGTFKPCTSFTNCEKCLLYESYTSFPSSRCSDALKAYIKGEL